MREHRRARHHQHGARDVGIGAAERMRNSASMQADAAASLAAATGAISSDLAAGSAGRRGRRRWRISAAAGAEAARTSMARATGVGGCRPISEAARPSAMAIRSGLRASRATSRGRELGVAAFGERDAERDRRRRSRRSGTAKARSPLSGRSAGWRWESRRSRCSAPRRRAPGRRRDGALAARRTARTMRRTSTPRRRRRRRAGGCRRSRRAAGVDSALKISAGMAKRSTKPPSARASPWPNQRRAHGGEADAQ